MKQCILVLLFAFASLAPGFDIFTIPHTVPVKPPNEIPMASGFIGEELGESRLFGPNRTITYIPADKLEEFRLHPVILPDGSRAFLTPDGRVFNNNGIFVGLMDGTFYGLPHDLEDHHHSSLSGGRPVSAAGHINSAPDCMSGHYVGFKPPKQRPLIEADMYENLDIIFENAPRTQPVKFIKLIPRGAIAIGEFGGKYVLGPAGWVLTGYDGYQTYAAVQDERYADAFDTGTPLVCELSCGAAGGGFAIATGAPVVATASAAAGAFGVGYLGGSLISYGAGELSDYVLGDDIFQVVGTFFTDVPVVGGR